MGMIGKASEPELKLHAAETNGLLPFFVELLEQHGHCLGEERDTWARGLLDLVGLYDSIRTHRTIVPVSAVQDFCDVAQSHVRCCVALGVRLRPKHHLFLHMGPRCTV